MTTEEPVRWYLMHDHGEPSGRHIHSTAQSHAGDVNNPRANDHTGVATAATLDQARAAHAEETSPAGEWRRPLPPGTTLREAGRILAQPQRQLRGCRCYINVKEYVPVELVSPGCPAHPQPPAEGEPL
jgi:hypothetical protein